MGKTYTTIQGDMWDLIAYKVYGRETCMTQLLESNPDHNKTVIFPQGIAIACPDIELPRTSILPPWKR